MAVAESLGLSWDEVHGMMKRAVERGLKRRQFLNLRHLGIDEKSFRRGHRYATLVNDLDSGDVLYVGGRSPGNEPRWVLADAHRRATGGHRGGGHRHVGAV